MAFVFAGIIALAAFAFAALQVFADGMRTAPTGETGAGVTLGCGLGLAALVAASHWLPHVGW